MAVFGIAGVAAFAAVQHGLPGSHSVRASEPTGATKSVIVRLKDAAPVTSMGLGAKATQQAAIKDAAASLSASGSGYIQQTRTFENLPFVVYQVDAAGEASLRSSPQVAGMEDDKIMSTLVQTAVQTVGSQADGTFTDGAMSYSGNGYAVAVIDTGVDKNHPALSGKVIAEACFGVNQVYINVEYSSLCPGSATQSTAAGSGQDCTLAGCGHGTKVAGAATMLASNGDMDGDGIPDMISGVANDASIIAVQIASKMQEIAGQPDICGDGASTVSACARPVTSSYLAAIDYIATLAASKPIAATNLSIGTPSEIASTDAECNAFSKTSAFNTAANVLKSHNIAMVVATGNSGDTAGNENKIMSPACSSSAIAVSATNINGTAIASYANNGSLTDLLAPGGDWDGTNDWSEMLLPVNGTTGYGYGQGTSFAAPMVAGAYATLRSKSPNATVDQLTQVLQSTGTDVTDSRAGYTPNTKKLIKVNAALVAMKNPVISAFTGPTGTANEGVNMTVNATVANAATCSLDNGVGNVTITSNAITAQVPAKATYVLTCKNTYNTEATRTLNTTVNAAPTKPAAISGVEDKGAKTYTVTWAASSDPDGIKEYHVYVNGVLAATLGSSATSYTVNNVQPGQDYQVQVMAVDTLGAISQAASVSYNSAAVAGGGAGAASDPTVPNTGSGMLKGVSWQLPALAVGALLSILAIRKLVRQK